MDTDDQTGGTHNPSRGHKIFEKFDARPGNETNEMIGQFLLRRQKTAFLEAFEINRFHSHLRSSTDCVEISNELGETDDSITYLSRVRHLLVQNGDRLHNFC